MPCEDRSTSSASAASASAEAPRITHGRSRSWLNRAEPAAVSRQNIPVAGDEANGIRTACSRPRSATHVTGSDHCCFMYGPVGPSAKAGCCSPQWPRYESQARGPVVGGSSPSGSTSSSGSMTSTGPVVSSQPKPVAALLPNHRPDSKYEACEPSAEKTIGCVPSVEEDHVASVGMANCEPSCWA